MTPLRLSRIATFSLLLSVIAAIALCAGPARYWLRAEQARRAQLPDPKLASPEETRAISGAVLAKMQYEGLVPPPPEPGDPPRQPRKLIVVLLDRSMCLGDGSECESRDAEDIVSTLPEFDAFAPRKLRQELVLANGAPQAMALAGVPGAVFARSSDVEPLLQLSDWQGFYRRYPDSSGLARITRPVLSEDGQRALVYIAHRCSISCGSGVFLLLERSGAGWRVVGDLQLRVQ